jgi:type I restriction enzyme R subunit
MPDPEALARIEIDAQLEEAGWIVQDRAEMNIFAGPGVAIREVSIPGAGEADYLLIAGGKAIGILEAKAAGTTLKGVEIQTANYAQSLPSFVPSWTLPLPMLYESTGKETQFTNLLDPEPRSRHVFTFHRPQALIDWVKAETTQPNPNGKVVEDAPAYRTGTATLAGRFHRLPDIIDDPKLWPAQREAISNIERSLKMNKPRALVQMATGSGKTFTAISLIYRLIRHADAKRILFLVDRANLGVQTYKEFQQFTTPDDGRKFTELYNVQHLRSNRIDDVSRVCISTIQRVYSILSGAEELDESLEEGSMFEANRQVAPPSTRTGDLRDRPRLEPGVDIESTRTGELPVRVAYNSAIPIEKFDIIVIDEAHRSIFHLWRQVLDYFDAYLIGLTATPNKQAFGFFNQNVVMEYTHEDAVRDKVNVPFDVYPIRTRITTEGSTIEAGYQIDFRDKKTRKRRWQELDEDLTYTAQQLDRDVVAEDQIRTVIKTFRDRLFTEIFPNRTEVPKTLIFAKDDAHADDIVRIVREEFGKGNDFCQKITYRTTGARPEDLLAQFRNNYNPRIVVTVDMIATGTDVKPIEIVMFMRSVKSRGYYEQMKGRGVRVMPSDDLKRVTRDAPAKTHFVIIDAVGVTESPLLESDPPMERKRSVAFGRLMEQIAWGHTDPATISSLAFRLSKLDKTLTPEQHEGIRVLGGQDFHHVVAKLVEASDIDHHVQRAREVNGLTSDEMPDDTQIAAAQQEMAREAIMPLASNADLRNTLIEMQARSEQVIDTISQDEVIEAGFSAEATERARAVTQSFRHFIEEHRDEITALQMLYNQPYGIGPSFKDLRELAAAIQAPPRSWTIDGLWHAYEQVDRSRVRGSGKRVLTDLVSLVRFAIEQEDELEPFRDHVQERFNAWLAAQETNGRRFTTEQRAWLEEIRDHIASSYAMNPDDLDEAPFYQRGGRGKMYDLFGNDYKTIIEELNRELAA